MKSRLLAGCGTLLLALLLGVQPALADPTIAVSPDNPRTGAEIRFEAGPIGDPGDSWDLDGDGLVDKLGSPVTWVYGQPGPVTVTLYTPDGQTATRTIQLIGPSATFTVFPAAPVAGELVQFIYSSHEATGDIDWDLNGDGAFGEAKGPLAKTMFPVPGTYAVSLRVTGIEDPTPAHSTSTQLIKIGSPPGPVRPAASVPRLMSPFPVVRITGKVTKKGARIKRLSIRAPYGATVSVRCRGRGCPFRRSTRTLARAGRAKSPSKTVTIRRLAHRLLHGGASVKVLVSRPGEIGKYTRFRIRRGKAPQRTDLCLAPGSTEPTECPSS